MTNATAVHNILFAIKSHTYRSLNGASLRAAKARWAKMSVAERVTRLREFGNEHYLIARDARRIAAGVSAPDQRPRQHEEADEAASRAARRSLQPSEGGQVTQPSRGYEAPAPQPTSEKNFSTRALRASGGERRINGITLARVDRRVEIAVYIDGERRGGKRIYENTAPQMLEAIERTRAATSNEELGTIKDGRFSIDLSVATGSSGNALFMLTRDAEGQPCGRPTPVDGGAELDALSTGIVEWLLEAA